MPLVGIHGVDGGMSYVLIVLILMFKSNGYQKYGFLMVFGGSLGNIFDRLYYSSVPDFIDIHINKW